MVKTLALLLLCQHLEVLPFPAPVGEAVVVRALAIDGRPLAGVDVQVVGPDESRRPLGATDAAGVVRWTPAVPGRYVYAATVEGVLLQSPHPVVEASSRWLYALVGVPLGLAFLFQHLRGTWRRRSAPGADQDVAAAGPAT